MGVGSTVGRQPRLGLHVGDVADQEVITWSAVDQVAVLTTEQLVVSQAAIDTTTPGGKLVFLVFAALAEFERDLVRERTAAARC